MNKQQAIERISAIEKEAAELRKIIEAPEKISAIDRFWEIMNGCVIYTEKESPNSIFWMKGEEWVFELENSYLYCRYSTVWSIFEKEYSMEYDAIQTLIKEQVEQRYKMKGITPKNSLELLTFQVEQRYKMKGITPLKFSGMVRFSGGTTVQNEGNHTSTFARLPFIVVEQRYKMKGITPENKKQ